MSGLSMNKHSVGLGLVAVLVLAAAATEAQPANDALKYSSNSGAKFVVSKDGTAKVRSSASLKYHNRQDALVLNKVYNAQYKTRLGKPRSFLSLYYDNAIIDFFLDEIMVDGKRMMQTTQVKLYTKKGHAYLDACTALGDDIMWLMHDDTREGDMFYRKGAKLLIECPNVMGKTNQVNAIAFDHLEIEIDARRDNQSED